MKGNNEKIQIILAPDFFPTLKDKHLLLDTNVLIDTSIHPKEWADFFNDCQKHDITLVTIPAVQTEFTRGSMSEGRLNEKLKLIKETVSHILPLHAQIFETHLPFLVQIYGELGKGVSLTDYLLAATLVQHSRDLYLLTKNPCDFPTKVFHLSSHVLISMDRALQCYGVYSYQKEEVESDESEQQFPF